MTLSSCYLIQMKMSKILDVYSCRDSVGHNEEYAGGTPIDAVSVAIQFYIEKKKTKISS